MTRAPARATDDELRALAPIVDVILDVILESVDPLSHRLWRRVTAAGGSARSLVVPEVNVDVIALARALRPMLQSGAGIIDVTPPP